MAFSFLVWFISCSKMSSSSINFLQVIAFHTCYCFNTIRLTMHQHLFICSSKAKCLLPYLDCCEKLFNQHEEKSTFYSMISIIGLLNHAVVQFLLFFFLRKLHVLVFIVDISCYILANRV